MTLSNHPAADLFPMLAQPELRQLADDIKNNGLMDAVVLFQGEVLDGRNRLAACELANVEPHFVDVAGSVESPVLYVISRNLHRRHLSTSQRAAIAAEMIPILQAEAKQRQGSRNDLTYEPEESTSTPDGAEVRTGSNAVAARAVGIGETSVSRAVAAKRDNPEGFEKVKRGELTVTAAAEGHTEQPRRGGDPKDTQTPKGLQLAEAHKRRMEGGLSTMNGLCAGLNKIDLAKVVAICTKEELQTWADMAKESAKTLRAFAAEIERGK